jgi:geranylgeranyl reductase family protein
VAVLDYRRQIGDKLCTGIVGRQCFDTYGVPNSLVLHEARGATFIAHDSERVRVEREARQAYAIDRVAFVALLAERAKAAGAEYVTGARVTRVEKRPGHVEAWYERDGETRSLRARSIIVAAGVSSQVARMSGLSPARDLAFASQAVVDAPAIAETQVLLPGIVPQGHFGWLVPQGNGKALLGAIGRPRAAYGQMAAKLAEQGLIADVPTRWSHWPVPVGRAETTVADRALLVGDAAGQVKPTTGGGIFYAMQAADMAAEALDGSLRRDDLSASALSAYDAAWKSALGRELRVGRIARSVYERLDGPSVKRLLKAAESSGLLKERGSFDWHADLIVRGLSYRMFDAILAPLRAVSVAFSALV